MTALGRLIYKATGIMSKRGIMKNCERIGNTLAQEIKTNGGNIQIKRVSELLENTIGKKKAAKITIAEDFDTFKNFAKENLNLSDELIDNIFKQTASSVIPPGKSGKSLLNLKIHDMNNTEALNTTAHELEHLLYNNVSTMAKFRQFILKCMTKSQFENNLKKGSNITNKKLFNFQKYLIDLSNIGTTNLLKECTEHKAGLSGLLKQTGFKNHKELQDAIRTKIRQDILLPYCNPANLSILKVVKNAIKDEARAYKIGGKVQRNFAPNENISKCEMISQIYNEASVVLKEEIKNQKNNIWRILFRKKPIDYYIPKPTVIEDTKDFIQFNDLEDIDIFKNVKKSSKDIFDKIDKDKLTNQSKNNPISFT